MRIQAGRIAPNDQGHRLAPARKSAFVEPGGNGRDMVVKRALRHQHGRDKKFEQTAPNARAREQQQRVAKAGRQTDHENHRQGAAHAPRGGTALGPVEARLERGDQRTQPLHWMADPRENRAHFAEHGVGRQSQQQDQQRIDKTLCGKRQRHAAHLGACRRQNQSTRRIR